MSSKHQQRSVEFSFLMKFFLKLGLENFAWAFRRLYCPVPRSALVLEVGSGGSPYFRANVLIDANEETRERHWAPFIKDRPSVLGMGESLPFKDKIFDFVIASHVLEHSPEPEKFLNELQRVGKAGYIETPDAFMERINPYWDHRSEVTIRDTVLLIRKKPRWKHDSELNELYESRAKTLIAKSVIPKHPFTFHTRFYWKDNIPFVIQNPEVDSNWDPPRVAQTTQLQNSIRAKLGRIGLWLARMLFSQRKRNKNLLLFNLLICPLCKSSQLEFKRNQITCNACGKQYHVTHGVPNMMKI